MNAPSNTLDKVVVRFAGDSGDGMQLTGSLFTQTTALAGNDLATFPDYPAEIRAPAGTREGVSGFQIQFSSHDIYTPGDTADVLVAMNPAALITNLRNLRRGGMVVVNTDRFSARDLAKARLETSPLEDGTLDDFEVVEVSISTLTKEAVKAQGLNAKESDRCKNFFALGMMYWRFDRDPAQTRSWIEGKFKEPYRTANLNALNTGYHYAETVELFQQPLQVPPATDLEEGTYRNITGNAAMALGFVAAAARADRPLFLGTYPITPASDILHSLAPYKNYGVVTFQAEDEIAGISAAIGASFGGAIGVTSTSGPGLALKGEALGLAVMTELPLIVVNVQRGGPSTGLPTKTEQSDLMQVMFGRNGESPVAVIAARSPADCFSAAIEAVQIAIKYMTPVVVMSDGYVANSAEPWLLPSLDSLPDLKPEFRTSPEGFLPYLRDEETLARPWAIPGTPGLEHRIGGLESEHLTGNVSYDPANHQFMCELRRDKIGRIADSLDPLEVLGADSGTLLVTWGSTFGAVRAAALEAIDQGMEVGHVHLRWLNPLPKDLGDILARYERVLVPELNLGQLVRILRDRYLVDARGINKIQGLPFTTAELLEALRSHVSEAE